MNLTPSAEASANLGSAKILFAPSSPIIIPDAVLEHLLLAAPLFPVAIGLIAGVLIDRTFELPIAAYIAGLFAASGFAFMRRLRRTPQRNPLWFPLAMGTARIACLAIVIAAICAGGILHTHAVRSLPADSVAHQATEWGGHVRLRGLVVNAPVVRTPSEDWLGPFWQWMHAQTRTTFLMQVEAGESEIGLLPASGLLRVTVSEAMLDLQPWERVEAFGKLMTLSPARVRNPGAFDWGEYWRRDGVVARLACEGSQNVRRLDRDDAGMAWNFVEAVRHWSSAWLTNDLATGGFDDASFLNVMILGHRSEFDRTLNRAFTRCGAAHFVAVSGTNVVMVIGAAWIVCRILGLSRRRGAWVMLAAVLLYALATEPRAPIMRATVIGVLFCISLLLRKRSSSLNWLSAAAIILLIMNPLMIYDAGFQLSFAAVLGVGHLAPALGEFFRESEALIKAIFRQGGMSEEELSLLSIGDSPRPAALQRMQRAFTRTARQIFIVSIAAWLATLPITLLYFQRPQLWGPVTSLILMAPMTLMMMLGCLKIFVTPLSGTMSAFVGWLLSGVDATLAWLVDHLAGLPGTSLIWRAPPWWLTVAYYAFLIAFVLHFLERRRAANSVRSASLTERCASPAVRNASPLAKGEPKRGSPGAAHPAKLIGCPSPWAGGLTSPSTKRWRGTQWICALGLLIAWSAWQLQSRHARELRITVLSVGAGSATVIQLPDGTAMLYDAGTSGAYDVGRSAIEPCLRAAGIGRIEHAYISHADMDHFSGVPGLLEDVVIGDTMITPYFRGDRSRKSSAGFLLDFLDRRNVPIHVMDLNRRRWREGGADFELLWPTNDLPRDTSDNNSSTVLRITYAGHSVLLTGDIEDEPQRALLQRGGLRADALVLPHHGSVRPSTKEFIDAVDAKILIRSAGQSMAETVNGLPNLVDGREIFNTADVGAIEVVIDARGIRARSAGD